MGLIQIRLSGNKTDLDAMMRFICDIEAVKTFPKLLSFSNDYPNRDGSGFRRYLDVIIESAECIVQEATLAEPSNIVHLEESL